jgi:short-subunit dehydrogenase
MAKFERQVIVITGASEGIGRALAIELARDRPRLVLAARSADRLASAADACREAGAEVLAVPTDISQQAACRALIDATSRTFGGVDILVNNAGATMWSRFDALGDLAIAEQLLRVNYLSAVWLTAAALPHLYLSHGLLVAIASVAGLTGVPERSLYAASKHAMVGYFDSLRIELAGSGVDVTIVAPDFVKSEIHRRAIGPDGRPLGTSPMQESRIMTAEACAQRIRRALARRERLAILSLRGRAGRLLKIFAPQLIDRLASRAIRERH